MQVQTNYSLNNQTFHPHFKSKLFNAQALQNVPNLTCACCGKKIIAPVDVSRGFADLSMPLSDVIQNGWLDNWKKVSYIWSILLKYAKEFPGKSLDTVVQSDDEVFHNLRHMVCVSVRKKNPDLDNNTVKSLSREVYQDILHSSRTELMNAPIVMERFTPFKSYLQGVQLDAFEVLQAYAQKYPNKRLSEILALPEVYNFHASRNDLNQKIGLEKLDLHFANILKIIKREDPLSVLGFKKAEEVARDILMQERDPSIRIPKIKNYYKNKLEFMNCTNVQDKVLEEIDAFPSLLPTVDTYFKHAHDYKFSDSMIIKNILRPYTGSFEHIVPRSRDGGNNIYNGIVMCQSCNRSRNTRDYTDVLAYHPEMKENVQKQIDRIVEYILSGEVDEAAIARWPIQVSNVLETYTGGLIKPDIRDYCAKAIALSESKLNLGEKKLSDLNSQIAENNLQYGKLDKDVKKLKQSNQELERQSKIIKNKNREISKNLDYFNEINAGATDVWAVNLKHNYSRKSNTPTSDYEAYDF